MHSGELKCVAVWQICETFSAKLLITAVFCPPPPPLDSPLPKTRNSLSSQSGRTSDWRLRGAGARMCRHHRADTDDKSSTYGQLSHRPTWLACAWCGRKDEHRRRRGGVRLKKKRKRNNSICLAAIATALPPLWKSSLFFCLLLQLLFMTWEDVIKIKRHKWLIRVLQDFIVLPRFPKCHNLEGCGVSLCLHNHLKQLRALTFKMLLSAVSVKHWLGISPAWYTTSSLAFLWCALKPLSTRSREDQRQAILSNGVLVDCLYRFILHQEHPLCRHDATGDSVLF